MKYIYLALLLSIASLAATAEAKDAPSLFDNPLKKQIIHLPKATPDASANAKLSCFYYPGFMVKEVDLGEKGADKLSITSQMKNAALPCKRDNAGEIIAKDWAGYYAGVKGDYVFFNADDGYDGGLPFAVFSGGTGQKLFEDSRDAHAGNFQSIAASGDGLTVRYRRTYKASCSLYASKSACWDQIKKDAGMVTTAPMPDCAALYEAEQKRTPDYAKDIANLPSMIGYEVEAHYGDGKPAFTALPGKVSCWLPD
jgi:hypothetical protein